MDTSALFADALCSRLHRLERRGASHVSDWWVDADRVPAAVAEGAAVTAADAGDSWDSALSNSPEDACWWSGGCGVIPGVDPLPVLPPDEGFLDDAGPALLFRDNDDDLDSVSSDGSEILQMVNQLLLAFNMEVAAAAGDAKADDDQEWSSKVDGLATGFKIEIETAAEATEDSEAEALSDHDFCLLPLEEFGDQPDSEECKMAGRPRSSYCWQDAGGLDGEQDCGEEADNEASTASSTASYASVSASAESHCQLGDLGKPISPLQTPPTPPPPPPQPTQPFLATGLFRMPQEAVLEAMDFWGPLDRIRWLLWRSEPCPPRQPQQPQAQVQPPRDKSKRACSFLLKGRCRKEDCEFAHDLSRVTCKFWAAGQCFKGSACQFLHGYASS